jgi:hypothetical protein
MGKMNDISPQADPRELHPPLLVGRLVRLITGLLCGLVVFQVLKDLQGMLAIHPDVQLDLSLWLAIAIGVYEIPDVMNIGFSTNWRPRNIRIAVLALLLLTSTVSLLSTGSLIGLPLALAAYAFLLYTFSHLGISFLMSALLATPGCEMRAMPQLWSLIVGKDTKVQYCPGFLTPLDRWEYSKSNPGKGQAN